MIINMYHKPLLLHRVVEGDQCCGKKETLTRVEGVTCARCVRGGEERGAVYESMIYLPFKKVAFAPRPEGEVKHSAEDFWKKSFAGRWRS